MTSSDVMTTWLGLAGVLIVVLAVTHWLVRRGGGWKALVRRTRREVALTARAFSGPVRTELRYRRGLRVLVRLLRDPAVWTDAERATALAADVRPGVRPYGVLAGPRWMGVLVAADDTALSVPPEPWAPDEDDPRLWWIGRADLTDVHDDPAVPPLLVCAGLDAGNAVLLNVRSGPPALSVHGPSRAGRTARAVLQALAAQLDRRLPDGRVGIAAGVHPRYQGAAAGATVARAGIEVAVCADPLERPLPTGLRLLTLGVARGRTRLLEVDPEAWLTVHGAPAAARVDVLPLARAVARALPALPPCPDGPGDQEAVEPPETAAVPGPADPDLLPDEPDLEAGAGAVEPTGVSATRPSPAPATEPRPVPVPAAAPAGGGEGDDDFAEPAGSGTTGVSAASPHAS
ncbi:hypothetical protein [Streptomyces sp. NPDC086787]|uniref:hypothetical protein n=1 Tax=Streptomyces sp. NPDC086787 TaxID=3365759 RepID=UPI003823C6BE